MVKAEFPPPRSKNCHLVGEHLMILMPRLFFAARISLILTYDIGVGFNLAYSQWLCSMLVMFLRTIEHVPEEMFKSTLAETITI